VITVAALAVLAATAGAWADVTEYKLLVVPVDFEDRPGTLDFAEFPARWVAPLREYFAQMSNDQLDLQVFAIEHVFRLGQRRRYHVCRSDALMPGETCLNPWNNPGNPIEAAVAGGFLSMTSAGLAPPG